MFYILQIFQQMKAQLSNVDRRAAVLFLLVENYVEELKLRCDAVVR